MARYDAVSSLMAEAVALHKQGRAAEAINLYRRLLNMAPRSAQARNNLAVALKSVGNLKGAISQYKQAVKLDPDYAMAHANLAGALEELGKPLDALRSQLTACRKAPESPDHRQQLARMLHRLPVNDPEPVVRQSVALCFAADDVDHDELATVSLALARRQKPLANLFAALRKEGEAGLVREIDRILASGNLGRLHSPLLQPLLTRTLVADREMETILIALRRIILNAPERILSGEAAMALGAALACQAFQAEYVFPESEEESGILAELEQSFAEGQQTKTFWPRILAYAMYRPPANIAPWRPPPEQPPGVRLVVRRMIAEPAEEQRLRPTFPSLTDIAGGVSEAVRDQYEESPYPRWLSVKGGSPQDLQAVLASLFLGIAVPARREGEALQVLVAGCGTGRHAIRTARRFSGAQVLAIDLSRSSLAYAARKACELGQENIRFAQADIGRLGGMGERFHLIECSGVLHHMADPEEGWRILRGLLTPSGLMRVGLYSGLARRSIQAARDHIRMWGLNADLEGIREARRRLRALDENDPAHAVVEEHDFHSASNCRDLLFNVQEVLFSLPRLAQAMETLDLEFLGFEFWDSAVRQTYVRGYPEDFALTNLKNWAEFEEAHPTAFRTMYQFWCRPR